MCTCDHAVIPPFHQTAIYGDLRNLIERHGSHWSWGDFGVPAIRLRPICTPMALLQRCMRPDGDLQTTDRQSTFCKAAIEPNQITLCWRSNATRKRSFALRWRCLRYTAFSCRSDCVVCDPYWSVCDARDPNTIRSPRVDCHRSDAITDI